jgi:capsular polysaccharide biosynthesis protein
MCTNISRLSITQRSKKQYRALQNENELIDALAARGFDIVEPERLSFPEQVRVFREAECVVGLGGAGLFNVIFCQAGTRVVSIESSTAFVRGHALLFGSLGHRLGIVLGKQDPQDDSPVHKRWTVNVPEAVRHIVAFT